MTQPDNAPGQPALLDLPNRDPRLPKLYHVPNHPLHASDHGKAYIFYQDLSKKSMEAAFKLEESLEVPQGTAAEVTQNHGSLNAIHSYDDHKQTNDTYRATSSTRWRPYLLQGSKRVGGC